MASSATLTSGVAGRYATAVFEIAREENALDSLESDLNVLADAIGESADFRDLLTSPIYSRDELVRAIGALAEKLGLGNILSKTLGLMAQNRRLFVLPALVQQVRGLIADHRGEVSAEVTSAVPLSDAQIEKLNSTLKSAVGSDVNLSVKVDKSLIGGLVVRVGSKMVDTSLQSKLENLQNVMKEVG